MFKWVNGIKYDENNRAVEADRGITAAYIQPGTKVIGCCAFHNCTELTSLILPDELESIEDEAFYGCIGLKTLALPAGIVRIGSNAFAECRNLRTANLPDDLLRLGINAFRGCPLENVSWKENGLTYWQNVLTGADKDITSARIKDGIEAIGDGAFSGCSRLASLDIPDSVVQIGCNAFGGCVSLRSVKLPSDIAHIRSLAFYGCTGLEKVTIPNFTLRIEPRAFERCPHLMILEPAPDFNPPMCA